MKKITASVLSLIIILSVIVVAPFYANAMSKPSKIKKLKLQKTCSTAVKVSWSKSAGASKYKLYRKLYGKTYKRIKTTSSRSCVAAGLKKNRKYTFAVIPYKGGSRGKATTKSINLRKAKTVTPKLTKSNCRGILKCLARIENVRAFVDYNPQKYAPVNIGFYNSKNYWLVTTKGINTVSAARNRMKKYITNALYEKAVEEHYFATYGGRLYLYAFATDSINYYDLKSIKISSKRGTTYKVKYKSYYGFAGEVTSCSYTMTVKFSNGYYKCSKVKSTGSSFVGYMPDNVKTVW